MHLNFHGNSAGEHLGAWKAGEGTASPTLDVDYYVKLAQTAERGLFDGIFYASGLALYQNNTGRPTAPGIDPVVLASVLAARTDRIGLIVTVSTTFNEPFNVAKTIATLDHVSGGRAAWNIVTTYDESAARNFGMTSLPPKNERYERAYEFVDVVLELWASWAPEALYRNGEQHTALDAAAISPIKHAGRFYSVHGPGQTPPSPQGRPVLFQAGASEHGKAFAAATAEGIFSVAVDLVGAKAFYHEMKGRIKAAGRDPDKVRILPGLYLYIGSTEAEARKVLAGDSASGDALRQLAVRLATTPERLVLDETPSREILQQAGASAISLGHSSTMIDMFRREGITVREYLMRQPACADRTASSPERRSKLRRHSSTGSPRAPPTASISAT